MNGFGRVVWSARRFYSRGVERIVCRRVNCDVFFVIFVQVRAQDARLSASESRSGLGEGGATANY